MKNLLSRVEYPHDIPNKQAVKMILGILLPIIFLVVLAILVSRR